MFILSRINNYVTTLDDYGTEVNLNYFKKTNKHKTFFGGISTIIFFMMFIAFALFKGTLMLK